MANDRYFVYDTYDLNSNIDLIKEAFDYLNSFSDIAKLVEDAKAAEAILYTYTVISFHINCNQDLLEIVEDKKVLELHYKLHEYFSTICDLMKNKNSTMQH